MIALSRLNGDPFVLNAEIIRTVEQHGDTVVTLVSGERLLVREPLREVVRLVIEYGRTLRRPLAPCFDAPSADQAEVGPADHRSTA